MRRVPEVLDCWFESGSMPFAQVHYPFENKEWFEAHFPGRLHRRVRRPDARLVLHAARAVDGAVRPAGVPERDLPRRRARRRGPQALQAAAQLPRPRRGLETHRLRRAALVPDVVADPARRRPRRSPRTARASPRSCAWCSTRSGTPTTSSRSTPTPTATRRTFRTDATGVLDRYVLAKTRTLVEAVTDGAWTPTTSPARATRSRPSSTR